MVILRIVFAFAALLLMSFDSDAGVFRQRSTVRQRLGRVHERHVFVQRGSVALVGCQQCAPPAVSEPIQAPAPTTPTKAKKVSAIDGAVDALDEVNAVRAARGLPPFQRCEHLTLAAMSAARTRANYRISGHTSNDFAHVPDGGYATAAGCAAWPAEFGWGACCTYDGYGTAGASYAVGPDGLRYMHIFVR